jgi:hypothetical protein
MLLHEPAAADWKNVLEYGLRVRWHVRYALMFAELASSLVLLPGYSGEVGSHQQATLSGPAELAYLWSRVSGDRSEIASLDGASQDFFPLNCTFYAAPRKIERKGCLIVQVNKSPGISTAKHRRTIHDQLTML